MDKGEDELPRLLEAGWGGELSDADAKALGFRDPARLREGLARLRVRVDLAPALEARLSDLLRALRAACDPDAAFVGLQRWLEAGGAAEGEGWCEAPFLERLCLLFAGTPALAEHFIRFPGRTREVLAPVLSGQAAPGPEWRQRMRQEVLGAGTHSQRLSMLRRSRTEALLRIAALDLAGESDLVTTTQALSRVSDDCLQAALEIAVERLRASFGEATPLSRRAEAAGEPPPPPLTVLALGKLGGRELNYSSDVDLIFAYGGTGPTRGGARALDYGEYFRRVIEELVAVLSQPTEDGRVCRVDLRLRPHGSSGPLVLSAAETLAYLQSEGRTWERQAWLKARACAGDLALGEALLLEAAPFVYPRWFPLDFIGDIQDLKRQIEHSVAKRGETEEEVKLGRGGIRDIEFTVQFLQLLHGGGLPALRRPNTLHALQSLRQERLLTPEETGALERAYVFWRQVEHRLQLHGDRQTHRLPSDPAARRRLALSLGLGPARSKRARGPALSALDGVAFRLQSGSPARTAEEAFESLRQMHVASVRSVFERLFAKLFPERQGPEGELCDLLITPGAEVEEIAKLLPGFGLSAPAESARELLHLGEERLALSHPARTKRLFASLAPLLLKALARTGEPDAALKRFSRLAASLGGKSVFYQALHENPWLLQMTVELTAWSEFLTDILAANPGLLDELVDALRTRSTKTPAQLEEELAELSGGGDIADSLRAYRAGELLRIGVSDLFHAVPLSQTQTELTDLATALLRAQLARTLREFQAAHGSVRGEDGGEAGFSILAVGKFGGREMNYGSDLDVLFFYGAEGADKEGRPAASCFNELAQELTRALGRHTVLGPLYSLDARLRPNGSKGPLAMTLREFERYWKEGELADWERLALTRARFVAGDAGVGERAEHLLRSAVYSPLQSTAGLAAEVRRMRKKLEESAEARDLKRGRGGLADVEFLVQYLQLRHGPAYPPVRQTHTLAALQALLKFRMLTEDDGRALVEAYEFFSRMANRIRVVHGLSANQLPDHPADLRKLALRAGYGDAEGRSAESVLSADFQRHSGRVSALFDRLVV